MFLALAAARVVGRYHLLADRFVPKLAALTELGKPWVLRCGDQRNRHFIYEKCSESSLFRHSIARFDSPLCSQTTLIFLGSVIAGGAAPPNRACRQPTQGAKSTP
jgi:hypothetical protein